MSSHPDEEPPHPTTTRSLLSEQQRQMKPILSSGERRVTRLSITYLRVTGEDMAVRMESGCVDVRGKPVKWPSGCSHVDRVLHDI